ncbi:hypothetical protein GCM10007094_25290 [Pseudovibrio japonicus]|uniref:Transposase n=1 Tax=Pseudovibrio japonicus TaxID=366534 RepID=A0ABQ3EHF6_9HYPH|nr:hypothetical protein [Pseudovibrio japonicus]GHB34810.1 hypothetical protein GCM10007094_25290 [Pseudovibrio japonicus]
MGHISPAQHAERRTRRLRCLPPPPLVQGLLTTKHLKDLPKDSPLGRQVRSFKESFPTEENLNHMRALNHITQSRIQTLEQMALAWDVHKSRRRYGPRARTSL